MGGTISDVFKLNTPISTLYYLLSTGGGGRRSRVWGFLWVAHTLHTHTNTTIHPLAIPRFAALGSSFFALSPSIAAKTYACDANGVHCPASPLLAFPQVVCYWTYYSRRLHKDSRPVLMHDNNFCRPVASSEKVTKIFAALIDATISFAGPAHHPPAGSALHWSGSWASRTQG